ncbi:SGNH/GDSL hydrolase family protein [Endobacterium cereale]|uniref:SGNH/GDSL hydrolase family protein n=1 Tax=Endobacterium cereale TaxID=2663029 RepID=UPI002B4906ED|nr:SGNH/GDSL hydrolase family protein [Endobacterium cereale]MEB2843818.1 SGNH/GDSL hydrolase family protein [Endobacterium cereale]
MQFGLSIDIGTVKAVRGLRIVATVAPGALIAAIGDSTVAGVSTGGGTSQIANSWVSHFANRLNAKGKRATAQNRFGCASGTWAALLSMDSRVTSTGAWTQSASLAPGGNAFGINNPAAAGSATISLGVCNKISVYWVNNTAGRIMDYAVDNGGPTGNLTTTGVYRIEKTELAVPAGQHSITFTQNTAHFVILGVEAYNDVGGMPTRFYNLGISGGTSTQMIDNSDATAGRRAGYAYHAPDLSIIEGGIINDWRQGIPVATSKANLTTLVQTLKAVKGGTGKVVLMTPVFDNGTLGNTANQELYVQAMREVAAEQGVPLIDIRKAFRSFAYAQSQGWMSDDVHPSAAGYEFIASILEKVIAVG